MKKFLSILALVLVVAMCASFAVSAAVPTDTISKVTGDNSASQAATLTYTAVTPAATVYSVDVTWDNLAFAYTAGTNSWDATNHQEKNSGAKWTDDAGTLTVTNHSNAKVAVEVAFQTASNGDATVGISGDGITGGAFELATAKGTTLANAPKKAVTLTASGVPNANSKLGDIVVTITAAN